MTVNNLRKSSKDDEIITVAKSLIKTWKKFVPEGDKKSESKAKEEAREERKVEEKSKSNNSRLLPLVQCVQDLPLWRRGTVHNFFSSKCYRASASCRKVSQPLSRPASAVAVSSLFTR